LEFADTRGPVETAGRHVVFVGMPEANAIGGIDRGHAIIAPAAVGAELAPRASKHGSFSPPEVIQWVGSQTPGITDAGKH
jgi:hypothetical protein